MNATDEQIAALEQQIEDATELPTPTLSLRSRYYDALFDGAGNELLRRLYESIAARILMMQNLSLRSTGRVEASRVEVTQMIKWIKARDVKCAAHASREHVRLSREAAIRALHKPL